MDEKIQQIKDQLIKMAETFDAKDFKKKALEELTNIEELTEKRFPHIAHIIDDYPEFDTIQVKVTQPDVFVYNFGVNPEQIKRNPELAEAMAKTICELQVQQDNSAE